VADKAARAVELVLALALIVAVVLNFGNVVGRYGFGRVFFAADELQTYIMVYLAFVGAALASWRGVHLRMDVLAQRLPARLRKLLLWVEAVLVIVLAGLVTWVACQYVGDMYSLGARSQTAQVPMWIPHLAMVLGFGFMAAIGVLRLIQKR
jgi:TRAP-type transport system small permease protein